MRKFLTTSLLFIANAAFGQDVSTLLDVSELQTQGAFVRWHNADSFAAFEDNERLDITDAAHACGFVSGAELKAQLTGDLSYYFTDKTALQNIFAAALADDASYQACRVKLDLGRPSGPGVDSGSIVYTIIDPVSEAEVVLGLYAEYY